jgi:hypothetical protein
VGSITPMKRFLNKNISMFFFNTVPSEICNAL